MKATLCDFCNCQISDEHPVRTKLFQGDFVEYNVHIVRREWCPEDKNWKNEYHFDLCESCVTKLAKYCINKIEGEEDGCERIDDGR